MNNRKRTAKHLTALACLIGLLALAAPMKARAFNWSTHAGLTSTSWYNTPGVDDYQEYVENNFDGYDFSAAVEWRSYYADSDLDWLYTYTYYGGFHKWLNVNCEGSRLYSTTYCDAEYTWTYGPSYYNGNTYGGDHRLVAALKMLDWAIYYKNSSHPWWSAKYLGYGLHLIQDYFAHLDASRFDGPGSHDTWISADTTIDGGEGGKTFGEAGSVYYTASSGDMASWHASSSWVQSKSDWEDVWRYRAAEALGERYIKSFIYETPWYYLDGNGVWGGSYNGAYSYYFGQYVPVDYLENYIAWWWWYYYYYYHYY